MAKIQVKMCNCETSKWTEGAEGVRYCKRCKRGYEIEDIVPLKMSEADMVELAEKDSRAFAHWKKTGELPEGWKRKEYEWSEDVLTDGQQAKLMPPFPEESNLDLEEAKDTVSRPKLPAIETLHPAQVLNQVLGYVEVLHADVIRLSSMVAFMMDKQFDDIAKEPTTAQARRFAEMGEKPWEKVVVRATHFEQWRAAYDKLQAEREASASAAASTEDQSDGKEQSNSEKQT